MNQEKKMGPPMTLNLKKVNTDKTADVQMEEFLKKEEILLDNGKTHSMLVRHYTNTYWTYLCFPCSATCLSEIFLHSHLKGKKHAFQILTKNIWPASIIENHPFYKKKQCILEKESNSQVIIAPGEPLPPGMEETEEVKIKSVLDENLNKHGIPGIGIEYMIEITNCEYENREPSYLCALCTVKGDQNTIVKHIQGFRHRISYMSIHYPQTSRAIQNYSGKRLLNVKLVEKICEHIEQTYGRLRPLVITAEDFEKNKTKYINQVTAGKHFTEQINGSLEGFVEKEYASMLIQMPELCSPDERDNQYQKQDVNDLNVQNASKLRSSLGKNNPKNLKSKPKTQTNKLNEKGSLSSLSDVTESDDDLFIVLDSTDDSEKNKNIKNTGQLKKVRNREREKNQSNFNHQDNADKSLVSEKVKWAQYRIKMKEFQEQAQKKFELDNQFPEKHQCYQKEWKKFWNRKCRQFQAENKDIMNIDLKPEWIEFWSKRMQQLHEESLEEQKNIILEEIGLPYDNKTDQTNMGSPISLTESLSNYGDSNVSSRLAEKRLSIEREIMKIRNKINSEEKYRRRYDSSISRRSCERSLSRNSRERSIPMRNHDRSPRRSCDRDIRNRERSRSHDRSYGRRSSERNLSRRSHDRNLSRRSRDRSFDRNRDKMRPEQNRIYRKRDRNYERDYDEKDNKYRRKRSPSPRNDLRGNRSNIDLDMKRKWRILDEKMGAFLSKYRKTYEEYLETPEKHPLYHNEWMKFKDSRSTFDDDDISMTPEWEKIWHNKLKQFRDEEIQVKKISLMKEIGIDKKYSSDRRSRDRQNSPERRSYDSQCKSYQPSLNDDLNVVAVLRHLTALENYLGSLGPKVVDMLATVLRMEKEKPNSSDNILLNDDYCVFLETVKEKLKGQLIADLIDSNAKHATKTAIQYVASLIHKASKLSEQNKKANDGIIVVSGIGTVDNNAIANQIANTLIAQGKTDVTTEELEGLVNAAIGMANTSHNSITSGGILNHLAEMRGEGEFVNKNRRTFDNEKNSKANGPAEEKPQEAPFMDKLSDADLKTLLQNFKDLSAEEQNGLISYLKKLESISPQRVEQLRKFINVGTSADSHMSKMAKDKEFSPFSSRKGGVNPAAFDEKNNSKQYNQSYNKPRDSDDDEDYNYDEVIKSAEEKVKERRFEEEMKIIKQSIMDSNKSELEKKPPQEVKQPVENKPTEGNFTAQSIVNVLNIVKNSSDMNTLLNSLAPTSNAKNMMNQHQMKQSVYPVDNNMLGFKDNNPGGNNMPPGFNPSVNPNKSNIPSLLNLNLFPDPQHQNNFNMKMNSNPTLLPVSNSKFMSHQPPMMMAPVNKPPLLARPQTISDSYNNYNKPQFMPRADLTLQAQFTGAQFVNENRGMPPKSMNPSITPTNNNLYANRPTAAPVPHDMPQSYGTNANFTNRFPNPNTPQYPPMNPMWNAPRNQLNKNWPNDTSGGQYQFNAQFGDASSGIRNKFPVRGRGATRPYGNQGGRGGPPFKHN